MRNKLAVVLRAGSDSDFILKSFEHMGFEPDIVILEKAGAARRKKLLREVYKSKNTIKFLFVDLPSLVSFDFIQRRLMSVRIERGQLKQNTTRYVKTVNDEEFLSIIKKVKPNYILNFGTSIYSPKTLSVLEPPIINWHTGILPRYRNVHTDFWAYVNNDVDGLGVSVFKVDEGIDTGHVIWTSKSFVNKTEYLWTIKRRNLDIVANSMVDFGKNPSNLEIKPSINLNPDSLICQTPTSRDLIRYAAIELRKWRENCRKL